MFTAPALGLAFSCIAFGIGLGGVIDARNNPSPTTYECREGLVAELGEGAWIEVSACDLAMDDAILTFDDRGSDAVFVPLVDPVSGEQAGILKSDNQLVRDALNTPKRDPESEPTEAEVAGASVLFATPRTGMTVRLSSDDRKLLTGSLRGLDGDEPVFELGETPHPTQSLIILLLGIVGLAASAWGVVRAKRAKNEEEAQLAAWRVTASQNPYVR